MNSDKMKLELKAVDGLRVLPLIDWYAARDDLETESGVSYLVRAGDTTVLFDLGYNKSGEEEPPLLRNMARLGVDPGEVDFVVISHPHSDHQGGSANTRDGVAVARRGDDPFAGKPLYSTVPLKVTGGESVVVDSPRLLSDRVGTTGALEARGFRTLEQSLLVNVAGKGLVLVVGCGHPGVEAMVERAGEVTGLALYGIIGGLHFPITQSRFSDSLLSSILSLIGRLSGSPVSKKELHRSIAYLKEKGVQFIAVSPHDSCDWSLAVFEGEFEGAYHLLRVGEEIVI